MSKVFFRKELVNNPVMIGKTRVNFEVLTGNRGRLELDEADADKEYAPSVKVGDVISALKVMAEKHKFGVVVIDEAEFEEIKKKAPLLGRLEPRKQDVLRTISPLKRKSPEKVAAVVKPPALPAAPVNPLANLTPGRTAAPPVSTYVPPTDSQGKRLDGPLLDEWLDRGYKERDYPPEGFASVTAETQVRPKPSEKPAVTGEGKPAPFAPRTAPLSDTPEVKSQESQPETPATNS